MIKVMVFGTKSIAIIMSLALFHQPKKVNLSAYGDSGTNTIYKKSFYTTQLTSGKLNSFLPKLMDRCRDIPFS